MIIVLQPINGILNGIFSNSQVTLNNVPASSNTEFHYIKSYLKDVTSFSRDQLLNMKGGEGFFWDDALLMNTSKSGSFSMRRKPFLNVESEYHTNEAKFLFRPGISFLEICWHVMTITYVMVMGSFFRAAKI